MELFEAISQNDLIRVTRLLENGVDANQFDLTHQYNTLHYAVELNVPDVVILLIVAGADLEIRTKNGRSVFDIASQQQNTEMLILLVKLSLMKIYRQNSAKNGRLSLGRVVP